MSEKEVLHWGPKVGMPTPKALSFLEALDVAQKYAKDLTGQTKILVIRAFMDGMNGGYRGEVDPPPNWEDFCTH